MIRSYCCGHFKVLGTRLHRSQRPHLSLFTNHFFSFAGKSSCCYWNFLMLEISGCCWMPWSKQNLALSSFKTLRSIVNAFQTLRSVAKASLLQILAFSLLDLVKISSQNNAVISAFVTLLQAAIHLYIESNSKFSFSAISSQLFPASSHTLVIF